MQPRLDLVDKAIRAGLLGQIQWKHAAEALARKDPELCSLHPKAIRQLLREFVLQGGELDSRDETRQKYLEQKPEHPFWYRARLPIVGYAKLLFVEIKIVDFNEDEPWVEIVSVHF